MNDDKKNYILTLCIQQTTDIKVASIAAEVAKLTGEYIEVSLGGKLIVRIAPNGGISFNKE